MDYTHFVTSSPKRKVSKQCSVKISPDKKHFSGNFTLEERHFDINFREKKESMRQEILNSIDKKTKSRIMKQMINEPEKLLLDDNLLYEVPSDVIGQRPIKPPRKQNLHALAVVSPRSSKEGQSMLKEQKKRLSKKYEGLIMSLMERCEENVVLISEKETHITKLKEKLKSILDYNKLFSEENDRLKNQHEAMFKYVEECKKAIKEVKQKDESLENRCKELEERIQQYQVPDRDDLAAPQGIPLVEVCMNCNSHQILLQRAREHSATLQRDMRAMKDVLYRLNMQLSRYQEKLRGAVTDGVTDGQERIDKSDGLDSLMTASLGLRQGAGNTDTIERHSTKSPDDNTQTQSMRYVDSSGLLSAQALAPLFEAYQDNLQEKDNLILDYEKQFENINKKSKEVVSDNKILKEKLTQMETDWAELNQKHKRLVVEKETGDIERATVLQRAENVESKLKEVYELYEDKISSMMRDYETVHREYFTVKSALEATENKMAASETIRARTVPADLHERRLEHCKRLLDELKHQYTMESERKSQQMDKLQQELKTCEEKYEKLKEDNQSIREELQTAQKNVKLYRKAAVVFRNRVKSATARMNRARRGSKRGKSNDEPLRQALEALQRIKGEIKLIKSGARSSLEELERRIVEQDSLCAECRKKLNSRQRAFHEEDQSSTSSDIDLDKIYKEEKKAASAPSEYKRGKDARRRKR